MDESNFRSDSLPSKQWQFNSNLGAKEVQRSTPDKVKASEVADTLTSTPEQLVAYGDLLNRYGRWHEPQMQLEVTNDKDEESGIVSKTKSTQQKQMPSSKEVLDENIPSHKLLNASQVGADVAPWRSPALNAERLASHASEVPPTQVSGRLSLPR